MAFYRFRPVLTAFWQADGLPFADVLSEDTIQQAFAAAGLPTPADDPNDPTVYPPALTLWAFLSQVLFNGEQRSCLAAVSRVIVLLLSLEQRPCADDSGAYCRARAKLPVAIIRRLVVQVADGCEQQ